MTAAGLLVLLALAACGKSAYEAEPIHEGVDRCAVCNMLIKDDANATEIVLKDKRVLKFDDIGDMFEWTVKNGLNDVAVRYVRDFYTKAWVKLEAAAYVHDKEHASPMGSGIVAFSDQAGAKKYMDENKRGMLMAPAELDKFDWSKHDAGMGGMDGGANGAGGASGAGGMGNMNMGGGAKP
jgi:copper chaperone NosL